MQGICSCVPRQQERVLTYAVRGVVRFEIFQIETRGGGVIKRRMDGCSATSPARLHPPRKEIKAEVFRNLCSICREEFEGKPRRELCPWKDRDFLRPPSPTLPLPSRLASSLWKNSIHLKTQ